MRMEKPKSPKSLIYSNALIPNVKHGRNIVQKCTHVIWTFTIKNMSNNPNSLTSETKYIIYFIN